MPLTSCWGWFVPLLCETSADKLLVDFKGPRGTPVRKTIAASDRCCGCFQIDCNTNRYKSPEKTQTVESYTFRGQMKNVLVISRVMSREVSLALNSHIAFNSQIDQRDESDGSVQDI